MSGLFGPSRVAKGTVKARMARRLADRLTQAGSTVRANREPGGSPGAEDLRQPSRCRQAERWSQRPKPSSLCAAGFHLRETIRPALRAAIPSFAIVSWIPRASIRGLPAAATSVDRHPWSGISSAATDRTHHNLDVEASQGLGRAREGALGKTVSSVRASPIIRSCVRDFTRSRAASRALPAHRFVTDPMRRPRYWARLLPLVDFAVSEDHVDPRDKIITRASVRAYAGTSALTIAAAQLAVGPNAHGWLTLGKARERQGHFAYRLAALRSAISNLTGLWRCISLHVPAESAVARRVASGGHPDLLFIERRFDSRQAGSRARSGLMTYAGRRIFRPHAKCGRLAGVHHRYSRTISIRIRQCVAQTLESRRAIARHLVSHQPEAYFRPCARAVSKWARAAIA